LAVVPRSHQYNTLDTNVKFSGNSTESLRLLQAVNDLKEKYHHVYAVIPLKEALEGIKVLIDGRTVVYSERVEEPLPGRYL
jgi:hypothetical protein